MVYMPDLSLEWIEKMFVRGVIHALMYAFALYCQGSVLPLPCAIHKAICRSLFFIFVLVVSCCNNISHLHLSAVDVPQRFELFHYFCFRWSVRHTGLLFPISLGYSQAQTTAV